MDEYEIREKKKNDLVDLLQELFNENRIEIEHNFHDRWETRYSDIRVKIDGKEVYHSETDIGSSGWKDY